MRTRFPALLASALAFASLALPVLASGPDMPATVAQPQATSSSADRLAPWQPRFGRQRPVIAVIGENGSADSTTELIDYVIPFGILRESGSADVFALATQPGPLKLRPALQIQPAMAIAGFDARFPDGADYVIVPATTHLRDPALLAWLTAQGGKGATLVSICDGALVLANTGLMDGHRATAHWDTQALRAERYPNVHWLRNIRYVADGRIVSSAGISAAIPTSLALVEAIAGHERAAVVAATLGVADWSPRHHSDGFAPQWGNLRAFVATNYGNRWFHARQRMAVSVAAGVDDIALALAADAYSRTGRSQVYSMAATDQPVITRHGLRLLPDHVAAELPARDRLLRLPDDQPAVPTIDRALADIATRYGRQTARGVALDLEYPGAGQ